MSARSGATAGAKSNNVGSSMRKKKRVEDSRGMPAQGGKLPDSRQQNGRVQGKTWNVFAACAIQYTLAIEMQAAVPASTTDAP